MLGMLKNALSTNHTDPTHPSETPEARLYHCNTCDTVYLDTEKNTCSKCETTLDEVPSSLSAR